MAAPISFQGLSTNLPTDKLVDAIITQESQPMVRLQNEQAANNQRTTALSALKTDLMGVSTSMSGLIDTGFQTRTVTSNDPSNSFVTATANGAAPASYDVAVTSLATRARMVVPAGEGMDPGGTVGTGTYTLTDMDGHSADIKIKDGNDTLTGLRDAINAAKDSDGKPLNVNASILKTGADGTSQLILSALNTGLGKDGADSFTLSGPHSNDLGLRGPLSSTAASNAKFSINGVPMERTSNNVTDAVDGMTFNLLAGDPTKSTTLTVALDKTAVTTAMQDVVTKYNAFYKDYKSRTGSSTDKDGKVTNGIFNNDFAVRTIISQVHDAIMGSPKGLPADASFTSTSTIGLKTNRDGTLSLNTGEFQAALDKDSVGVANVFNSSGFSSNPALTFLGATSRTTTHPINVKAGRPDSDGVSTAQFSTTGADGTPFTTTLKAKDGKFNGDNGTPLEGLAILARPGATGTINVTTGVAQGVTDVVNRLTSAGSGNIGSILSNISTQNFHLSQQIATQQEHLDHRKKQLHDQYSKLETTVGQMQAAGQSVSSMQ